MHSLKKIQNILFNKKECIKYILKKQLVNMPLYQNCNNIEFTRYKKIFRCKDKSCSKSLSVTKNSFFEKSKMQICDILLLGYLWLNKVQHKLIETITN